MKTRCNAIVNNPIIGLTTYGRHERDLATEHYDEFYFIPADYVDAVRRAGGVPILLPPGETNWQRWLDATDGIIVIGQAAPDDIEALTSQVILPAAEAYQPAG